MRFSSRAGDATISKKSHHHRKQEIARVAAALHSPAELSIYRRMSTLMIFIRNHLDFGEHWYFPPKKNCK